MVGGVTPGKGGQKDANGLPIFDTVRQAVNATGADATMIFVPPPFAADAIMEAADAGIRVIVAITEGVPVLDMVKVKAYPQRQAQQRADRPELPRHHHARRMQDRHHARLHPHARQRIQERQDGRHHLALRHAHVRSRLAMQHPRHRPDHLRRHRRRSGQRPELHRAAGDVQQRPRDRRDHHDRRNRRHRRRSRGGVSSKTNVKKPVVAFIAGRTAPPGRRMGHAGAIISGGEGTAESKIAALKGAGISVAESPATIGETMAKVLGIAN